MDKINAAIELATQAHSGQRRKLSGEPYILHPMEVAVIVARMGGDEDAITAGLLHDVVEDCGVSLETVREKFGDRVAELVAGETEDKRRDRSPQSTWKIRKVESLAHLSQTVDPDVRLLWLADKLSNLRSILRAWEQRGDTIWDAFNEKNKTEHQWYYDTIAVLLKPYFGGTAAFLEYVQITQILFGGKKL